LKDRNRQLNQLLIPGLTPYFLEKPVLWWKKNEQEIIQKRHINPIWLKNTVLVEQDQKLNQSAFLRSLADLGYEKILGTIYPGTFKHLGSTIIIYPTHKNQAYAIDFLSNTVKAIEESCADVEFLQPFHKKSDTPFRNGDYIVHIDHGIGIFRGITKKDNGDYFKIEYAKPRPNAESDLLWVPTDQKKRVEPYLGLETPKLHRLSTPIWQNIKKKAKENIIAYAKELIQIYQKRSAQNRPPYKKDPAEDEIWDAFEYDMTLEQEKALYEILKDLSSDEPMERLLVGDVGFGKTEVALRAALRVALNGKQVALLAPTTILADQHIEIFSKRLKPLPLIIAGLTRLESKTKIKKTLNGITDGQVDIVIGTHRMFSKDVIFKRLGLLIVDEEQRFGVKHKEHFKKKYPSIDILSLSATPIPRTLSYSLAGVRACSKIQEAPRGRQAPLTQVLPSSKKIVKEALKAELARNGQSYFLASRIRTIPKTLKMLNELLPYAKKAVLHGRMAEKEIVETMQRFRKKEIDILISTTIIENGLDISSVNTIIVENALLLGLAQAHQLRGRVGRGNEQAFAYFLYNPAHLTAETEKRLQNLIEFQSLGSGIEIAKRDLETRGAGNILGKEQSGVANRIGWNLYFQFMNQVMEELR